MEGAERRRREKKMGNGEGVSKFIMVSHPGTEEVNGKKVRRARDGRMKDEESSQNTEERTTTKNMGKAKPKGRNGEMEDYSSRPNIDHCN